MDDVIEVFTDGSSLGNPGPGGFAAILRYKGKEKIISGGEPETTNNRMEMRAVISALKAIKNKNIPVKIYSDSSLIVNTMNDGWKKKKNVDLWEDLAKAAHGLKITWHWVRGHANHPENNRVDAIAVAAAKKQKKRR